MFKREKLLQNIKEEPENQKYFHQLKRQKYLITKSTFNNKQFSVILQ
jgi:hypothetical protein